MARTARYTNSDRLSACHSCLFAAFFLVVDMHSPAGGSLPVAMRDAAVHERGPGRGRKTGVVVRPQLTSTPHRFYTVEVAFVLVVGLAVVRADCEV